MVPITNLHVSSQLSCLSAPLPYRYRNACAARAAPRCPTSHSFRIHPRLIPVLTPSPSTATPANADASIAFMPSYILPYSAAMVQANFAHALVNNSFPTTHTFATVKAFKLPSITSSFLEAPTRAKDHFAPSTALRSLAAPSSAKNSHLVTTGPSTRRAVE